MGNHDREYLDSLAHDAEGDKKNKIFDSFNSQNNSQNNSIKEIKKKEIKKIEFRIERVVK